VLASRWQTIPESGVVRPREPFKLRWDRIMLVLVVGHQFITLTVNICEEHAGLEASHYAGLSAAAKSC